MREPKSLSPAEIVLWYEHEIKEDIPAAVDYYIEYCREKANVPFRTVVISAGVENLKELVDIPFIDFVSIVDKVKEVNSHFLEIFADRLKRAKEMEKEEEQESTKEEPTKS